MKDLFDNEIEPRLHIFPAFVAAWCIKFPTIGIRMPRDGKKIHSLIDQTKEIMTKSGMLVTDPAVLEFWTLVLENLPEWFQGKTLPVIDSHYPSIVDQIINNGKATKQKQLSKFSRQAGRQDRANGS